MTDWDAVAAELARDHPSPDAGGVVKALKGVAQLTAAPNWKEASALLERAKEGSKDDAEALWHHMLVDWERRQPTKEQMAERVAHKQAQADHAAELKEYNDLIARRRSDFAFQRSVMECISCGAAMWCTRQGYCFNEDKFEEELAKIPKPQA